MCSYIFHAVFMPVLSGYLGGRANFESLFGKLFLGQVWFYSIVSGLLDLISCCCAHFSKSDCMDVVLVDNVRTLSFQGSRSA